VSLLDFKSSCPQSGTVGSIPTHLRQTAKASSGSQNTEANGIWIIAVSVWLVANGKEKDRKTENREGSKE